MKTILAILTAALLLLLTPGLSQAHRGHGEDDRPRVRQEQRWDRHRKHHDHRSEYRPPRHQERHYEGRRWGHGHHRPPWYRRRHHHYRYPVILGAPNFLFQFRW